MLDLGKQVLKKIENLLVQVDRKRPNPFNPKQQSNTNKSKSKSKSKQVPENSRKPKPLHIKNPSTNEVDKQNICSHRLQQLYLNHFIKEKRILNRNLLNMEQQMKQFRDFKVQNKTSQFINQKKQLKPIYERTSDILRNKQKSIQKIKQSVPKKIQMQQNEEEQAILQEVRKRHPKLNKEEFQRRMQEMEQRNLLRMQKTQKKRLKQIAERSQMFTYKPEIQMPNKIWWEKKKLKKNLSTNVLQRFSQYDAEKRQKWERYLDRRKQEQTPFTPKISDNTKQIAKKSLSRRSLIENLPRSLSCRALSKRDQSTLSFIEKIDKEEKIERKNNESTERSLSRNMTHGKSVATMSSSRNALVEKRFN